MYIGLHVKYRYSCQILIKLEFSELIFEKHSIKNFMKISLMGAKWFRADGRTGMTKLTVAFGGFANAPKISLNCSEYREIFPHISEGCSVDVLPMDNVRRPDDDSKESKHVALK